MIPKFSITTRLPSGLALLTLLALSACNEQPSDDLLEPESPAPVVIQASTPTPEPATTPAVTAPAVLQGVALVALSGEAYPDATRKLRNQPFGFTVHQFTGSSAPGYKSAGRTDGSKFYVNETQPDGSILEYLGAPQAVQVRELKGTYRQSMSEPQSWTALQQMLVQLPANLSGAKLLKQEFIGQRSADLYEHNSEQGKLMLWLDVAGAEILKLQRISADGASVAAEFKDFRKPQNIPTPPRLRRVW